MDEPNLASLVVEFLHWERHKMHPHLVAEELIRLASLGAQWPKATNAEWQAAITTAITDGRLEAVGDDVRYCLPKPTLVDKKPVQMGLFG